MTLCNAAGRARREHRRAGHRADPGQRPAPRRVRPPAGRGRVAAGARPGAGRPARADRRLRPDRRRPSSARLAGFEVASVTRVARRARDRTPRCTRSTELPELLPEADVVIVIAPADARDRGADRRRGAGPAARRRAAGQRRPRPAGRHRRPGRRDRDRPDPGRAGRHRSRAAAGRPPAVARSRTCSSSPHVGGASTAFLPRADRLVAAQLRRFAAGEPLENVIEGPMSPRPRPPPIRTASSAGSSPARSRPARSTKMIKRSPSSTGAVASRPHAGRAARPM